MATMTMEDPYLAAGSVPAETSGFFAVELEAFVDMNKVRRPHAWARVEALQRCCRELSPATMAGAEQARSAIAMPSRDQQTPAARDLSCTST